MRFAMALICFALAFWQVSALGGWYDPAWHYRVPITVPAGASVNSTVKVDVDFNALLAQLGVSGTFDVNSPRVVRPNDTLATVQEFTDSVYGGATDPVGNGRGEVRFLLEDAGPATYYLYFDITQNGSKAPNPQQPIDGNFEHSAPGVQNPPGWTATKSQSSYDTQIRPSETVTVTDSNGTGQTVTTDGTPHTGQYSYLLGSRTNADTDAQPSATLFRTIRVPATNPGNLVVRYRVEGWDSSDDGATQWDFLRIQLVGNTTTEIVGPTYGNYTTYPFSPNKGLAPVSNSRSGYGQYNGWDTDLNGRHRSGMALAPGSEPWFTRTVSLLPYAGQTITLRISSNDSVFYRSWFSIDDVEWSVVGTTVGAPETGVVNPGGFNAFETSTPAGAVTGVIKTKIAGSSFNLDLVALNTAKTAVQTSFTGTVKVELLDASAGGTVDANGCNAAWPTIQTLAANPVFGTGNNGRLTVPFLENNAWQNVRVRISYPVTGTPTAVGCSTDNFAIRPAAFANLAVTDADWQTAGTARLLSNTAASGGVVHKAGRPFTVNASAVNGTGAITTNYGGAPVAVLTGCLLPAGCATANLGNLALGAAFAGGVLNAAGATYSEAGAFTMQLQDQHFADVDAADSSPAERYITSAAINVGRFVPDHFDLSTANSPQFKTFNDTACTSRSFTYIGQPFGYLTAPQALISAKNAGGSVTANYSGNLWKLNGSAVSENYSPILPSTPALDTGLVYAPIVTSNGNGTGSATTDSNDLLAFIRNPTTPQIPFNADISLTMSATDSSEASVAGNGTITTAIPAVFNGGGGGIAFDSGNEFRYGRLWLGNAYGSELLPLPVPLQTQYWNGVAFVANTADNCTVLAAVNIGLGNYQKSLAPCETGVSLSGRFSGGTGKLVLPAPGAGNNGSVDLTANLGTTATGNTCVAPLPTTQQAATAAGLPYLQGRWSGSTYDKNPVGRAAFGIYKNASQFIYMRELY